nr:MAG TPA: deoxyribosyltransferase [Caudoviricetes sp.]
MPWQIEDAYTVILWTGTSRWALRLSGLGTIFAKPMLATGNMKSQIWRIMKMNKKIYISGAIAHYDLDERKAVFKAAEERLRAGGYRPINPFNNGLPQPGDWRKHMKVDIGLLLQCDYIYMLKDWWVSKGAKLELDVATSCGIEPVFEEEEKQTCCICGKEIAGNGNDPYPIWKKGTCCDQCNATVVLPERLRRARREL